MSEFKSIVRNTVWLTIGELVTTVLIAVGGIMLARSLGDVRYGQYAFALSFVSLFSIMTEFGINLLFINEVSQNRTLLKEYFAQLLGLKLALGMVFFVVMATVIQFTGKSHDIKLMVYFLSASLVVSALMTLCAAVIRIHEQMKYEAYFRMVSGVVCFIIVVFVFIFHLGYVRFVQYSVVANLLILIAYFLFVRHRYVGVRISANWHLWRSLLVKSIPLGLSIIFVSIYYNLGSVMLSFWKNDQTVGWYNADSKLILLLITFINLYYSAAYPVISRLMKPQADEAQRIVHITSKFMIVALIPVAAGATILAHPLLNLLYGAEFTPGAPALQVLIWTTLIMSVGTMYGFTLIAAGKRSTYMWGVAIGALVNVIVNAALIPRFSAVGAALGTVIAEFTVLIFMYVAMNRMIFWSPLLQYLPKPLFAGACMAALLWFLPYQNVLVLIAIGAGAYLAVLVLVRGVTRDELIAIRSLFQKEQPIRNTEHENWY